MPTLLDLADESFVSLTTFKRSGEGIPTTVWIARDGDALYVTTPAGSGKVKRLRNDPRVELRPSSRLGRVADDAPVAHGVARIDESQTTEDAINEVFLAKYGLEFRIMMGIEKLGSKRSKTPQSSGRVILRITEE